MSMKRILEDVSKHELDEVVASLKKKGAKILEIREQDDGLYTVIYEIPDDNSSDEGGSGGSSFDFDVSEAPMSEEGGSRDFP